MRRMARVRKLFRQQKENIPKQLNSFSIAREFLQLAQQGFINEDSFYRAASTLGIRNNIPAMILIFRMMVEVAEREADPVYVFGDPPKGEEQKHLAQFKEAANTFICDLEEEQLAEEEEYEDEEDVFDISDEELL